MRKEKLNTEELNHVISIGARILKLFYAVMIVLLIAGITLLLREWNVIPVVFKILSVINPFFVGFVIAWLLNPMVNKLTDKGLKRGLAVGLVYIMLIAVIYLFCWAVIPTLIEQINEMAKMIPEWLKESKHIIDDVFLKLSRSTNIDMSSVKLEFMTYIEDFAKNMATNLPTTMINIVQGFISGVGQLLIAFVIGFYLLFNFNNANSHLLSILPRKIKGDAEELLTNISKVLYKFVNGTLLVSLILFVVSVIGFEIIGLDAPVLFAMFGAVTNIIPYVGPYIGGIPAVLVGFTQSPVIGILTLIFIVAIQGFEGNFLHPIVIGKKMDLHPVTIVISLLIFEYFFGIIGMIIATPIVAVIKIIYVFLDEKFDLFRYSKDKSVKKEISKVKLS
jgi:predicted PurR-regulated permease PerM